MQVQTKDQETIYTHRTIDGHKARVLAVVNNADFPYVISVLTGNKEHITQYSAVEFKNEFFEYNPWQDVEVDTPILVRDNPSDRWFNRHFAKYEDGKVFTWYAGYTSWSSIELSSWSDRDYKYTAWNYAKLPDKE